MLSFSIFDQNMFYKFFEREKYKKTSAVFELMTYRFVVNALNHCATLLDSNVWNERNYKIIHDFIVYFDIFTFAN